MSKDNSREDSRFRSLCPVASSLDLIGDRWTIVVIRDMLNGASKYGDFLASPEKITTNILADRLHRMEAEGLVSKVAYQEHPPRYRYHLTPKGEALSPVLAELRKWGKEWARHSASEAIKAEEGK
jgi:DNA-binding HxlR family transcriptional regulator